MASARAFGNTPWLRRIRADRAPGAGARAFFVGASLTPVMVIFIAFSILPIIAVIAFSFFRYSFSYPDHTFRGLSYYRQLGADPLFWNGLKRTAIFVAIAVPLNVLLSLPAALGLQRVTRFKGTLRAFFFLPTVISTVAVSLLGIALYDPSTGLINQVMSTLHLPIGHWLGDNNTAMPALAVLAVWQDMGYNVIIFLAGLQAIPPDFYEAARIDGAGPISTFRHITVPLLQRTSSFTVILTVISYLQTFTYQQVMLAGGPDDSTRTISLYIYDIGIGTTSPLLSQAMAAAVVLLVVIMAVTLVQLRLSRVEWDY
ncbi:MAG: binding-protein-dependent transport system inner rane component [Chloroflexi bacterium]|nr:binding-protein-dependent transport system inner rane component [Chloroflexota bacterium]